RNIVGDTGKWVINPVDESAIEEALRVKEKVPGSEVVLVSIGAKTAQEQLRTGLAMGADRAILVLSEQALEPLAVARVIQKLAETEKPDLLLMGKQAIDDDSNCVGQMVAELLAGPQATLASSRDLAADPVVAEHLHGKFPKTTLVSVAAGKQAASLAGGKCLAAVLGQSIDALASELAEYGVDVVAVDGAPFAHYLADAYTAAIVEIVKQKGVETVIAAATAMGQDLLPRMAAHLGAR